MIHSGECIRVHYGPGFDRVGYEAGAPADERDAAQEQPEAALASVMAFLSNSGARGGGGTQAERRARNHAVRLRRIGVISARLREIAR